MLYFCYILHNLNHMLYNQFLWLVRPFINARWNSIMFPPQSLEATVNISVQQIYNEYKWSWLFTDEDISAFTDLTKYFVADIANPVKYILGLEYQNENDYTIEMFPEHSRTQIDETTYTTEWQTLLVKEEHDYTLTYIKDYTFMAYAANPSLEIPIPNNVLPALYYLVLSQLDLVDAQQLQWQPANNFNKYQYEIKNLKANDMWYEAKLIWGNPQ